MNGNIVVGQSGGPTAVINSSVAGVYSAARKLGAGKVYGMVHGIEGFLADKLVDLDSYLSDPTGIEMLKENTLRIPRLLPFQDAEDRGT